MGSTSGNLKLTSTSFSTGFNTGLDVQSELEVNSITTYLI